MKRIAKIPPGRLIAAGFGIVIIIGSILLILPVSHSGQTGITYLDALFTSVSCVCVTGLTTVETGVAYSGFGQAVILILIQIGGLGITTLGAGLAVIFGLRLDRRNSALVKEALNYQTWSGIMPLIRSVIILDLSIELIGAVLYFVSFIQKFSFGKALWYSVFHAVSAFNNAGFDVLGNGNSFGAYTSDIYMNVVTCLLIITGGLGFFVIREILTHRRGERFSLHTKVVLSVTGVLLLSGAVLVKITEGSSISLLGAVFASVTARTAGFATYPLSGFSNAGLLVMCVLMFIGASPGSTGGGMKTTTVFALVKSLVSNSTGREARTFGKKIPDSLMHKATLIITLGFGWALLAAILISAFEPGAMLRDVVFETISALGTVGLSTGITPTLSVASRVVIILTMYLGRLGPLTIATLWTPSKSQGLSRPEEAFPIG